MAKSITIAINGNSVEVIEGTTVAAAILNTGLQKTRRSSSGEPRGPICGMGICFECRVTVNGHMHVRACLTECLEGMVITTDA